MFGEFRDLARTLEPSAEDNHTIMLILSGIMPVFRPSDDQRVFHELTRLFMTGRTIAYTWFFFDFVAGFKAGLRCFSIDILARLV